MARSSTRASGATSKATKESSAKKSSAKKASGKKASTKEAAPEKASGKKASTKKAAPEKASAKKTATKATRKKGAEPGSRAAADAPRAEPGRRVGARQVAAQAASELLELTGKSAEGVTGLERTDDGWTVQVEVVEVHRIPNTTDVLALYEVQADERGSLLGYRRVKRYARGAPGED